MCWTLILIDEEIYYTIAMNNSIRLHFWEAHLPDKGLDSIDFVGSCKRYKCFPVWEPTLDISVHPFYQEETHKIC